MIDFEQLKTVIVDPLYRKMANYSEDATTMFMMCVAHESDMGRFVVQRGHRHMLDYGRGIAQIQANNHNDVWANVPTTYSDAEKLGFIGNNNADRCIYDMQYSAFIFRKHFHRFPESVPSDLTDMSIMLKDKWNTAQGKASPLDYYLAYEKWSKGIK